MAQLDIFGLPVVARQKGEAGGGPRQGLLIIDDEAIIRHHKDRSRLGMALQHCGKAVGLLWEVKEQRFRVPPADVNVLRDALAECRDLRRQLEKIENELEEAIER